MQAKKIILLLRIDRVEWYTPNYHERLGSCHPLYPSYRFGPLPQNQLALKRLFILWVNKGHHSLYLVLEDSKHFIYML